MNVKACLAALYLSFLYLPVHSQTSVPSHPELRQEEQREAAALVRELREFPAGLPGIARSDGTVDPLERRREAIYERLRALNGAAISALSRGLKDPEVRIRRNAALALTVLAGSWYKPSRPRLDIRPSLPALIEALGDSDSLVRARAAHAIGDIGPAAVSALPPLLTLLEHPDEGSRIGACIALRGIGSAASSALPALRQALNDPSEDVRQFAAQAIRSVEGLPADDRNSR